MDERVFMNLEDERDYGRFVGVLKTLTVIAIILGLVISFRHEIGSSLGQDFSRLIDSYSPFIGAFAGFVFSYDLTKSLRISILVAVLCLPVFGIYYSIISP